jgi:hypothetical protein
MVICQARRPLFRWSLCAIRTRTITQWNMTATKVCGHKSISNTPLELIISCGAFFYMRNNLSAM